MSRKGERRSLALPASPCSSHSDDQDQAHYREKHGGELRDRRGHRDLHRVCRGVVRTVPDLEGHVVDALAQECVVRVGAIEGDVSCPVIESPRVVCDADVVRGARAVEVDRLTGSDELVWPGIGHWWVIVYRDEPYAA